MKPDHLAKLKIWRRQAKTLGAEKYRITCVGPHNGINFGARSGGEHFFSAEEVEKLIPRMRRFNAQGYNVFLTPISETYHFLVVDDLSPRTLREFRKRYSSCLILETSLNNYQAILRIPKLHSEDDRLLANRMVRRLNLEYGDRKFSGAVHAFRVASFSNRKKGRNRVFVKLFDSAGTVCENAIRELDELRARVVSKTQAVASSKSSHFTPDLDSSLGKIRLSPEETAVVDNFKHEFDNSIELAHSKGWELDFSICDYRAATSLLEAGVDSALVLAAMLRASPSIELRHRNPKEYAMRTIKKALSFLEERRDRSEPAVGVIDDDSPESVL